MHAVQAKVAAEGARDGSLNYAVMASFMKSGRMLDHASSLLLIAATLACLFGAPPGWLAMSGLAFHLGLAVAAKYYGWRVALDAELFQVLARHVGREAAFDQALADCLGRQMAAGRSACSRWEGARRLLRFQSALVVLQAVGAIATALALPLVR